MPPQTEAAVLAGGAKRFYNLHRAVCARRQTPR
jgi:hypothetical protein